MSIVIHAVHTDGEGIEKDYAFSVDGIPYTWGVGAVTALLQSPPTLPVPQTSTVTPAERRALSDSNRPRDARALQRDRLDYERITWPPMAPAKTQVLLDWWRDELIYGGAWFSATWPLPRGFVSAVRKMREQPRWQFVPGGYWRISALCEVRGRGEVPEQ